MVDGGAVEPISTVIRVEEARLPIFVLGGLGAALTLWPLPIVLFGGAPTWSLLFGLFGLALCYYPLVLRREQLELTTTAVLYKTGLTARGSIPWSAIEGYSSERAPWQEAGVRLVIHGTRQVPLLAIPSAGYPRALTERRAQRVIAIMDWYRFADADRSSQPPLLNIRGDLPQARHKGPATKQSRRTTYKALGSAVILLLLGATAEATGGWAGPAAAIGVGLIWWTCASAISRLRQRHQTRSNDVTGAHSDFESDPE